MLAESLAHPAANRRSIGLEPLPFGGRNPRGGVLEHARVEARQPALGAVQELEALSRARGRSLPLDGVARGVLRLELLQHLRERWTHGVTREVVARLDRLL